MILDSISVGLPQEVDWKGKTIKTSIYKHPVDGPRQVSATNIAGDKQSDLNVHGGPTRAVSVYATEYYDFWKERLSANELPFGYFGENLNISGGMFEKEINVGDRFTIGSVEFEALQPRFPCQKLGMKMGDSKWIKEFLNSRKTGFYFGVIKEGIITPGDTVIQTFKSENSISIDDITDLYLINKNNKPLLEKALKVDKLTPSWKDYFKEQLDKLNS